MTLIGSWMSMPWATADGVSLCVSGGIAASAPLADGDDLFEARVTVPGHLYRSGTRVYAVTGDSMDDGSPGAIRPGQWVLVDAHSLVGLSGRVAAYVCENGAVIVKRLGLYRGRRALLSDNPRVPPLTDLRGLSVLGRVYAVLEPGGAVRLIR